MVELIGEDSGVNRAGIYTAQDERKWLDMVDDRTGNGDDVGQEGIEGGLVTVGAGKSLGPTSWDEGFNVQLMPGPRSWGEATPGFFEGHRFRGLRTVGYVQVVHATPSQTQTTTAKITEAYASLRVTGVLGRARMRQNEETGVSDDEEARYCYLRDFLCVERCDTDFRSRGVERLRHWLSSGMLTTSSNHSRLGFVSHSRTQMIRQPAEEGQMVETLARREWPASNFATGPRPSRCPFVSTRLAVT